MESFDKTLLTGWMWLIILSALAALISALTGQILPRTLAGSAILILALLKARVILSAYLGLREVPGWLSGFSLVITLWGLTVLGLYLAPGFG